MAVTERSRIENTQNPENKSTPTRQRSQGAERRLGLGAAVTTVGMLAAGALAFIVMPKAQRTSGEGEGHTMPPRPAVSSSGHAKVPRPVGEPSSSKGPASGEPHVSSPALVNAANAYHLSLDTVGYNTYARGTQKYAALQELPNQYYNMTSLTGRLALSDFERLRPVLVYDELLYVNTQNPHYMDIGSHTNFGPQQAHVPWKYVIKAERPVENGFQTGLDSFTQGKMSIKIAPYSGESATYQGRSVIDLEVAGVPVQDAPTSDNRGGYIDDIPGDNPPMSSNGPQLNFKLQIDPQTNMLISDEVILAH